MQCKHVVLLFLILFLNFFPELETFWWLEDLKLFQNISLCHRIIGYDGVFNYRTLSLNRFQGATRAFRICTVHPSFMSIIISEHPRKVTGSRRDVLCSMSDNNRSSRLGFCKNRDQSLPALLSFLYLRSSFDSLCHRMLSSVKVFFLLCPGSLARSLARGILMRKKENDD